MSIADTRQVGGNHYGAFGAIQHWDFTVRCLRNRYLEGNATKYLDRWRDKEGLKDIRKARTYVAKLIAEYEAGRVRPIGVQTFEEGELSPATFCQSRGHDRGTTLIFALLANWAGSRELDHALRLIDELIERLETNLPHPHM